MIKIITNKIKIKQKYNKNNNKKNKNKTLRQQIFQIVLNIIVQNIAKIVNMQQLWYVLNQLLYH